MQNVSAEITSVGGVQNLEMSTRQQLANKTDTRSSCHCVMPTADYHSTAACKKSRILADNEE